MVYNPRPTAHEPLKKPPSTSRAADCHKIVTRLKPLIDLFGGIRRDIRHGIRLFVRRPMNAQQVFRPATFPDTQARATRRFSRDPRPRRRTTFCMLLPFVYSTV